MHNLRWSDLEYILAVAVSGSVAAAARKLDVNHSTVLRRVQTFEDRNGIKIFNRLRSGYRVTAEGEIFLDAASSIEEIVQGVERKIVGVNTDISGEITVTTTDSLFPLLTEATSEMRRQFPEISYRLDMSNKRLDLDRHDADIAIRASVNPPPHLIGRKISDMDFGIYATKKISGQYEGIPLKKREWLGLDAPLLESVAEKWMQETIPESRIGFRCGSFVALAALAAQDVGFVLLPVYLGRQSGSLIRTDQDVRTPSAELWILTHKDVLASPRVSLVAEHLYRHLRGKRKEFTR